MRKLKEFIKMHKLLSFVTMFIIVAVLSWTFINSFSADIEDSAWDGVVAKQFTSGTGTEENPYIISNASEYAHLKTVLEGEDANFYADKIYKITGSFNYGEYDISINNTVPFAGLIDGNGNSISNATVNNSLFASIDGGTIRNLKYSDLDIVVSNNTGVFSNTIENSELSLIILSGSITLDEEAEAGIKYTGVAYTANNVELKKLVVDITPADTADYISIVIDDTDVELDNVLVKKGYTNKSANSELDTTSLYEFEAISEISNEILDNFSSDTYKIIVNNDSFEFDSVTESSGGSSGSSGSSESSTNLEFTLHDSGLDSSTKTIYINDLDADWNYYMGLNYTYRDNLVLSDGTNSNKYNSSNMVRVMIYYSGSETINGFTFTGEVSPTEAISNIVYYKWFPIENNQIKVKLLDNPYSKRPTDLAFNGWVLESENGTISIDYGTYERYATIPVSGTSDIVLKLRPSWTYANVYTIDSSNPWSSAMSTFYSAGIRALDQSTYECNFDLSRYYLNRTISRGQTCTNCYYRRFNWSSWTFYSSYTCNSGNCSVYERATTYSPSATYYIYNNGDFTRSNPPAGSSCSYVTRPYYRNRDMAGFFVLRNFTRNDSMAGYYDVNGNMLTGTCGSNNCTAYQLLDHGNSFDENTSYYFLVTRDINIAFQDSSNISSNMTESNTTKPFTLTAYHNGINRINSYYYSIQNSSFKLGTDVAIENIRLSGNLEETISIVTSANRSINANFHNLKLGRGITQYTSIYGTTYVNSRLVTGGTGSSSTEKRFNLIIESGYYSMITATQYGSNGYTDDLYVDADVTLGSDIDRITKNNDKLTIYHIYGATLEYTTKSSKLVGIRTVIKSGSIGTAGPDESENNQVSIGVYNGGRYHADVDTATSTKVEGGWVFNLIGSPSYTDRLKSSVAAYLYVTGGEINTVFGGAGTSETYGHRVISITGGKVNYSVFGGSNGVRGSNAANSQGTLTGSTLVYVGGNAQIGDATLVADSDNNKIFGFTSGNVFGVGNGNASYDQIGSADNSTVIIDGSAKILGDVYGSGNYGTLGYGSSNSTTTCNIKINGGTINGNVFGAGNQSGSGTPYVNNKTNEVTSTVNIEMTGGTVSGNIYGSSNADKGVYGAVNIAVKGGNVTGNVYGGGYGQPTYVRNNVNITIGDTVANQPRITGSVYGGSAFGIVNGTEANGTAYGNTTVTVNNGVVTGSVFGGGQGSNTVTPYVLGNINVNINGGDITNVFGGNDQAGSHTKTNNVYLNGGTVQNAYGGGNKSSVTNTHVTLAGASVTNIYGGSNTSGTVSSSTVNINSGSVQNAYGGNNEGGTCSTTDVNVVGTAQVTGSLYGGGNEVGAVTTHVTLTSAGGTIPNVYGGGNKASVTTTNITDTAVNVTNMFGGSNSTGAVTTSNITYNGGTSTNVFGGNNAGGNTITSNISVTGGTVTNVYGGGNKANGSDSHIDVSGGNVTKIFGGGNQAGLDESHITVSAGNITEIYGGSNNSGTVDETDISITNSSVTVGDIYGGGNRAEVGDTNIVITDGHFGNVFAGGNLAQVTGSTVLDINGGTINNNVYGGGNDAVVNGSSNVTITDATILGSIYAGGNGSSATLKGNTNLTIDGDTVVGSNQSVPPVSGCVFGGGNQAYTGTSSDNNSTTNVNIVGGTIYGNVYGGANTSVIYGNTIVNIGKGAITSNDLVKDDIHIYGHIFGGGEANSSGSEIYDWSFISVTQGANISIDADTYNNFLIDGSFFGGGNASTASGDSYLSIRNYGETNVPKRNISIQRVTYVTIDNSSILLRGAYDRANEYGTELFAISRVKLLKVQNNSEMYFESGTNLLEEFSSLDANGNKAVVTIDKENNTITQQNVNNRVYLYEGAATSTTTEGTATEGTATEGTTAAAHVNIATNQQITEYGHVYGMSFLGLYNYDTQNNVNTGIYNAIYNPGDQLDWSGTFSRGSYVLGMHTTNHDLTKDGFYTNNINETTQINEVDYVEVTPEDGDYYMWYVGVNVIEYNVSLVASKYSTLGSVEKDFLQFNKPNTSFQITSFNTSSLAEGISLVDRASIPRIAADENTANNTFGLAMEASNSGWLTTGKTTFYTQGNPIRGVTYYEGENSTVVPTMLFYLYHSKNITEAKSLGTVRISVMAITKLSAIANEVVPLVINVDMSTALFNTVEYEGAMTPGDKYELFTSTTTNITNKSKFSTYFGLYDDSNVYKPGYHRALTSSFVLPEGTKLTMLDFVHGVPEYYYHVITAAEETAGQAEFALQGEASYNLSIFTRMGSKSNNSNYDDAAKNAIYYDGTNSSEEFIFIVDFGDTTIPNDALNNSFLIEIRDSSNESKISVLGMQHDQLKYSLYADKDSHIDMTVTPDSNPLYIGYNDVFDVLVNYQNSTLSGTNIIDTQYFDSRLGVQIYILDNNGEVVNGTELTGSYFLMDNQRYYPDISGYTHIKLIDKVGNARKWITFNTENASLSTGSYTFVFETFASPDGIYFSSGTPVTVQKPITIINSTYGLDPTIDDESIVFSANNDKSLKFNIKYTSRLTAPNIRIAMYRRKYDEVYDTHYELVDFKDFVDFSPTETSGTNEYLITGAPLANNNYEYQLNSTLVTGTYRLSFRLYDEDTMIGEIVRYIIVK